MVYTFLYFEFCFLVINPKTYIDDIAKSVIKQLEDTEITGLGMPMWDFQNNIKYVYSYYAP